MAVRMAEVASGAAERRGQRAKAGGRDMLLCGVLWRYAAGVHGYACVEYG